MRVRLIVLFLFVLNCLYIAPAVGDEVPINIEQPSIEMAIEEEVGTALVEPAGDNSSDVEEEGLEEEKAEDVFTAAMPVFTANISDDEIITKWTTIPGLLGPISMGVASSGTLINGELFPEGMEWHLHNPAGSWGTTETIEYTIKALKTVNSLFEGTPPLSIGDLSRHDGGKFRPHKSHQAGRDVDLGFYYNDGQRLNFSAGDIHNMDLPRNWALMRALIIGTDVQMILVDKRVQKLLYDYALYIGEDKSWLDSIFKNGRNSIIKHARRHRGHYHVRFFNPKAQELGRRLIPLMKELEQEEIKQDLPKPSIVSYHEIRNGDCLGSIARLYGVSVAELKKANGLRKNAIRAGRTLIIPAGAEKAGNASPISLVRRCPIPPKLILPERRHPPTTPDMFANVQGLDHRIANVENASIQYEKFLGSGGLFPPFRTFSIPMAY